MRKVLACLALILPFYGLAQTNTEDDILLAKKRRNGVYRSFMEFRTNAPTMSGIFKIVDYTLMIFNEKKNKFRNIHEKFWGACLNDTLYILIRNPKLRFDPRMCPIDFIGRYCYFTEKGTAEFSGPQLLHYSKYRIYEYIININNGVLYDLDTKLMRRVLEKELDLLEELERGEPEDGEFRRYIEKVNERRTEDIKPIDEVRQLVH